MIDNDPFAADHYEDALILCGTPGSGNRSASLRPALGRVDCRVGLWRSRIAAASPRLGHILRRARLANGLTQEELAHRVKLSQAALSMIENGRGRDGLTLNTIVRICEALELKPLFLPANTDETSQQRECQLPASL